MLLLWVYYSRLIFYFGAEFTKSYADHSGSHRMDKQSNDLRSSSVLVELLDLRWLARKAIARF